MAAKKYLSLEEAADVLTMPVGQLNKLRESGELRGFADRGTWKFKAGDIEEFARTREVTSNPDVPLLDDSDPDPSDDAGALPPGQESIEFNMDDAGGDDVLADDPTLVRGDKPGGDAGSESDVKLALDDDLGDVASGAGDADLSDSDSDSDVRLVGRAGSSAVGSDSDVRLIADEPSAINLGAGSDSDVALVADSAAAGSGASVLDDDQPAGGPEDSQLTLGADSGIALESPLDSGIALESGDSGIALSDESSAQLADDGAAGGSGIALDDDSDVALGGEDAGEDGSSIILLGDDSGIALADDSAPAADAGGAFGDSGAADSGIALDFLNEDDDGPAQTKAIAAAGGAGAAAVGAATEADMSALDDSDSYPVADDAAGGADTSVILFEDDDDDFGVADVPSGDNTSQFELEEDFDDFGESGEVSAVSAEVLTDDDDDDLDVFEASDDDFDDEFQSGASHAEFAPVGVRAAPETEFDPVVVSLLGFGTLVMLVVGVLAFDLVRSMWGYNEPNVFNQTILQSLGGMLY